MQAEAKGILRTLASIHRTNRNSLTYSFPPIPAGPQSELFPSIFVVHNSPNLRRFLQANSPCAQPHKHLCLTQQISYLTPGLESGSEIKSWVLSFAEPLTGRHSGLQQQRQQQQCLVSDLFLPMVDRGASWRWIFCPGLHIP